MPKELEEKKDEETPPKNLDEKVDKKLESAEKKVAKVTGERENIIGDISKPNTESPDFDFKQWAKSVDQKIDSIIDSFKSKEKPKPDEKPEEIPPGNPPKKESWLDRKIF